MNTIERIFILSSMMEGKSEDDKECIIHDFINSKDMVEGFKQACIQVDKLLGLEKE
jgi:hypothetical protein